MKTCTKCGETKRLTEFNRDSARADGLRCHCKACISATRAAWYADNLDKARATNAAWKCANRDSERARLVAWHKANPEARRINEHNRRARERANGGKLSKGIADKLFRLQRGKCACGCKQPLGDDYHMDHRMPLALGGTNTDDNMQLLRSTCNLQKHSKHPVDFMQERGFLI